MHRIFTTSVASVHPHYVAKVEKKSRTRAELDQVICWLTGFDEAELAHTTSRRVRRSPTSSTRPPSTRPPP